MSSFTTKGFTRSSSASAISVEQVVDSVGDGSAFGLEVAYSFDGPDLQGTGGAIKRALPLLGSTFFVLYGDSYLECDYQAIQSAYEVAGKLGLMTVFRNQGQWDTQQRRVP